MVLKVNDLNVAIADAKEWLAAQPKPQEGTATWYGFNNFRSFIASLEADASASNLEQTCHALGWHISDQYGAYNELTMIAEFNERVRQISKAMLRAE
jgi:hypothetical protein